MIDTFRAGAAERAAADVGRLHCVLVEGPSRRSDAQLVGRTDTNKRVILDDVTVPASWQPGSKAAALVRLKPGDYVAVRITASTMASLAGMPLGRTTLREFYADDSGGAVLHAPRAVEI